MALHPSPSTSLTFSFLARTVHSRECGNILTSTACPDVSANSGTARYACYLDFLC